MENGTDKSQLPPAHLPVDPRRFFAARADGAEIALALQAESQHVLEQLGPPAFRKSSFPMIGFLASLYEHVAMHVSADGKSENVDGGSG